MLLPNGFVLGKKNAQFMGYFEKRKIFEPWNKGLLLDGDKLRLSEKDSFRNLALVGGTWFWKTSAYIMPNVLDNKPWSMVITDPSWEILANAGWVLQEQGFDVQMLNLIEPEKSIGFNAFHWTEKFADIDEVALIPVRQANPNPKEPIWSDGAWSIISILARTLANHPEKDKYYNFPNILNKLNEFWSWEPLNAFVAQADKQTYSEYKGFISSAPATLQGMLTTAKMSLRAFNDPEIASLTASQTFDFANLRKKRTALFLIVPEVRTEYYAFLMNLFYTRLFHYCLDDTKIKKDSLPVYFYLDEFWQLKIPNFPRIVTTNRKRKVSISIMLQDLSQLEEQYWRAGADTIKNWWIMSKIYGSGGSSEMNAMLSGMLWNKRQEIINSEWKLQIKDDSLVEAHEIRTMQDREALFLFDNKNPAKIPINRYFNHLWIMEKIKNTPYVQKEVPEKKVYYHDLEEEGY